MSGAQQEGSYNILGDNNRLQHFGGNVYGSVYSGPVFHGPINFNKASFNEKKPYAKEHPEICYELGGLFSGLDMMAEFWSREEIKEGFLEKYARAVKL